MKRRLIVTSLVVTSMGIGLYGLHSWAGKPAVSTETQGLSDTSSVLGSSTTLAPWQTAYFTTELPSYLRSSSSVEDPSKPIVGSYLLVSSQPRQDDQVAVTVGTLGNLTLKELPAVKLRTSMPGAYKPVQLSYGPAGLIAFSRTDAYETSVFWQSGPRYAAVVVSGTSDRQPDLDSALSSIVSNWHWR